MGTDLYFILRDPDKIWQACAQSDNSQTPLCIKGALFSSFVGDPSGETGLAICRKIDSNYQKDCFRYLGNNMLGIKGESARNNFCNKLKVQEGRNCMGEL